MTVDEIIDRMRADAGNAEGGRINFTVLEEAEGTGVCILSTAEGDPEFGAKAMISFFFKLIFAN